jgi:AAA domain
MNYDNIPNELKDLDRWVVWREGKIPYDAKYVNSRASSTNPDTWSSFEAATTAYEESDEALGIGFVLNGDGLVGVDIDHVVTDGVVEPAAVELLDQLGAAYISLSPSGHGLRAFGYATPLLQGCKGHYEGIAVELYSSQRYLTITDQVLKLEPLGELKHFSDLAHYIRSSSHVNTVTGEVIERKPNERHSELVRRILTGTAYHDSLRDLAASLAASGMHQGALVNHLRGLMDASPAPRDQRYNDRYRQIPELVRTASNKYKQFDPFQELALKEDEDLFDSLGAVFADNLPTEYTPPDELVEDILITRNTSILYGSSNSGKTFWALSMAAAISRGADFLGKRTQEGMVVYMATESPETVRTRLQAYMRHHDCILDNILLIQKPVNFFTDNTDVERVIAAIKQAEDQRGKKASLIIGDTLARISAGANENAGQDMGPVMNRIDYLMNSTVSSVMMIHHSGKMQDAGARGWSGIRAFVDTEIEVTDVEGVRKATISKQRALGSKGDEMYFNLMTMHMGFNKWGKPSTSCVVTQ